MLIYQKYVVKNISLPFVMTAFSMIALVWITQILKLLYLFDKGISIADFCNLVILILPSLLFVLLPIITVIAVLYAYHDLSAEQQLIVLQSAGLSHFGLIKPALYVAVIATLGSYYLSAIALPESYTKLKSNLSIIKNNYISNVIDAKTFNQISKDITIYANRKLSGGMMEGIIIWDNRNHDRAVILFSQFGRLKFQDNKLILELSRGIKQEYDTNDNLTELFFQSLVVQLTRDELSTVGEEVYNRDINEYYIHELLAPDSWLTEQKKNKFVAEGYQRLLWPLYNFILPFFALSVFLTRPYNRNSPLKPLMQTILCVVIITIGHFVLQNFASKNLNFIFACYANAFIAIMIGLHLSLRRTI